MPCWDGLMDSGEGLDNAQHNVWGRRREERRLENVTIQENRRVGSRVPSMDSGSTLDNWGGTSVADS